MKIEHVHNNFTLLRLALAVLVLLGHFKILPGVSPARGLFGYADFAVDAFFVVSGYLVAGSFERRPSFGDFYLRRFFRIYPLFLAVILLQTLVMVLLLGGLEGHGEETLRYLAANMVFATFLAHDIGGLFAGFNDPGINPSLWTLKIEAGFYLILPVLWLLARRFGPGFLVLAYMASTVFAAVALEYGAENIAKQLPGQLRFFIVGIALYRYRDFLTPPPLMAAAIALALFALCTWRHDLPLLPVYPLCVGGVVFLCALRLPAVPLKYDISYGVYLVHGPLIQLALLLGIFQDNVYFLCGLLVSAVALALLAEALIERPGIEWGKRLARKMARSPRPVAPAEAALQAARDSS